MNDGRTRANENRYQTFKLRAQRRPPDREVDAVALAVPARIWRLLGDDWENLQFMVELTEEGILYRPVDGPPPPEVPAWVKERA